MYHKTNKEEITKINTVGRVIVLVNCTSSQYDLPAFSQDKLKRNIYLPLYHT